ncbi:MAG: TonB family protein [Bacteroidota bacterium]
MATSSPGCFKVSAGIVLVVVGTLAGGQLFYVGAEVMAVGLDALGVSNPVVGWALIGGIIGALAGVLVGLRRAGRRRMLGVKVGAFLLVLGLLLLGILRAGEVIDREIRVPVLYSTTVGTENLNVRPAPSTDNTPITVLPEGTPLDVLEERPNWVRVRLSVDGRRATGWVSRAYVASPSDAVFDAGEVSPETGQVESDASDITLPILVGGIAGLRERLDYPDIARNGGIDGRVVVTAVIDERGRAEDLRIASSPSPMLSYAAIDAIRDSRFRPARRQGRAVKVRLTIPVDFELE